MDQVPGQMPTEKLRTHQWMTQLIPATRQTQSQLPEGLEVE